MANPQKIVDQLLALSEDPENQAYIVRESGCLAGLVGYLSYPDSNVVFTAAKAIWHLSSGASNREAVKKHPGLLDKLAELKTTATPRVRDIVVKTQANLVPATKPLIIDENSAPVRKTKASASAATTGKKTGSSDRRARPIKMKVEGIAQEYWRSMVERALIRVPGVISVTLNKRREEAIVYTKKREGMLSTLVKAVEGLGMEAQPLDGTATTTPRATLGASQAGNISATARAAAVTRTPFAAVQEPTYLDEEDEMSYFGEGVMTRNMGSSSLEARLAAKRKEEAAKKNAGSSVASMFGRLGSSFGLW